MLLRNSGQYKELSEDAARAGMYSFEEQHHSQVNGHLRQNLFRHACVPAVSSEAMWQYSCSFYQGQYSARIMIIIGH